MRSLFACLFLLSACAGGPPGRPEASDFWSELAAPDPGSKQSRVFKIRELGGVDRRLVNRGLDYYVNGPEEKWEIERGILCEDALRGYYLARALSLFAYTARKTTGQRTEILVGTPASERPIAELVKMGEVAVPCVVIELLPSRHPEYRAVGVEVAQRMGSSVLPTFKRALEVQDARTRRLAAEVLASWEPNPMVLEALHAATTDEDFGVRAAAWRGLAQVGGAELPAVLEALRTDDAFVQRAIVGGLAAVADKRAALALVAYMERSIRAGDQRGGEAADASLRLMSGRKGRSTLEGWQSWARSYVPSAEPVKN